MKMLRTIFFLSFFLVAACSTAPVTSQPAPNPNSDFTAEGIVGVTTGGEQNNANFTWFEIGNTYHIELYGPLGLGSTFLDGNTSNVTLTLSNQETYTATSPEILMQQVLGWSLPVQGLRYWLLAKPVPGQSFSVQKDNQGRLISLSQQGWQITYTWNNGQNFPHKVVLVRPGVKAVIVINKVY